MKLNVCRRLSYACGMVLLAACTTPPPAELGVRVADAASDSGTVQFTVTVVDTSLSLGMRPASMAMRPDKSLVLTTPASIVVNRGAGSAVITAVTEGARIRVSPLDPADSATGMAVGRAVRITRRGTDRHIFAQPVPPPTP